jgi:hypothetical protein
MAVPAISYAALDQRTIDISDDDELRFWTREFRVGSGELYEAIRAVGTSARFVMAYLSDTADSGRWPASTSLGLHALKTGDPETGG